MYPGRTLHAGKDRLLHSTPPSRTLVSGNGLADASRSKALPALGLPRRGPIQSPPAQGRAGSDPLPSTEQQAARHHEAGLRQRANTKPLS